MHLQIQPAPDNRKEYMLIAESEGLSFELMDFSRPAVLDSRDTVDALIRVYENSPVMSIHGVFIDICFTGGDPLIFDVCKKRIEQSLECALRAGASNVVLHSCFLPVLPPSDPLYELWSEGSAAFLGGLCDRYRLKLFIENMLDRSPDILLMMMKRTKREDIRVCLDVGHANFSGTPVGKWIDTLAPYIGYVHLSDNNGVFDEHLALGDGNIDWEEFFAGMTRYGINPIYTLEVKNIEGVKKSLAFLDKLGVR